MTSVEIVKELAGFKGEACLVRRADEYFVVSSVDAYSGFETLAFPADSDGKVVDWGEVAGGRGVFRDEVIAELAASA